MSSKSVLSIFQRQDDRKEPTRNDNKPRRRPAKLRHERSPAILVGAGSDVITEICKEVSRQLLKYPDVRTGSIFDTAMKANLPINMSDSIILVSACMLEHIGNTKAAAHALARSETVTKMYERMNLNDERVRSMYVTVLFTMNPAFIKMIESSIDICLRRLSKEIQAPHSEAQMAAAFESLSVEGSITRAELADAKDKNLLSNTAARRTSLQITPTDMIAPDDSASVVTKAKARSESITEADLMQYVRRKQKGRAASFEDEFPTAKRPPRAINNRNRRGLGYSSESTSPEDLTSVMEEILKARKEGSTVPLTPSTMIKGDLDKYEVDTFARGSIIDVPDTTSEYTTLKSPIARTRQDPSVIALEEELFGTAPKYATKMTEEPEFDLDALLDDL